MKPYITTLLLCLLCACSPKAKIPSDLTATRTLVSDIDTLASRKQLNLILAARLAESDSLARVLDEQHWPDNIRTTYNLLFDSHHRLVLLYEIPTSESGDWNHVIRYYFDEAGTLRHLSSWYSYFNSGCTDILRIDRELFYDSEAHVLSDSTGYFDRENHPFVPDTSRCNIYQPQFNHYLTVSAIPVRLRQLGP
jgi:hypothetical protein